MIPTLVAFILAQFLVIAASLLAIRKLRAKLNAAIRILAGLTEPDHSDFYYQLVGKWREDFEREQAKAKAGNHED